MTARRYLSGLRSKESSYRSRYEKIQAYKASLYSPSSSAGRYSEARVMGGTRRDLSDRIADVATVEARLYNDMADDLRRFREITCMLDQLQLDPIDVEMILYYFADGLTITEFYKKIGLSYCHARRRFNDVLKIVQAWLDENKKEPVR